MVTYCPSPSRFEVEVDRYARAQLGAATASYWLRTGTLERLSPSPFGAQGEGGHRVQLHSYIPTPHPNPLSCVLNHMSHLAFIAVNQEFYLDSHECFLVSFFFTIYPDFNSMPE